MRRVRFLRLEHARERAVICLNDDLGTVTGNAVVLTQTKGTHESSGFSLLVQWTQFLDFIAVLGSPQARATNSSSIACKYKIGAAVMLDLSSSRLLQLRALKLRVEPVQRFRDKADSTQQRCSTGAEQWESLPARL